MKISNQDDEQKKLVSEVLKIEQLAVKLSGNQILDKVNFEISHGELVGLIGPNGAGKTTLMRAIMQLIPISQGKIVKQGNIGYVPQRQDLDWAYPITVEQLVKTAFISPNRYFSRLNQVLRRKKSAVSLNKPANLKLSATQIWAAVYRALRQVDLFELRKRNIDELSGGQKQRVLIARALAANPAVLLLDEPFTGLDHPNQDALAKLFMELRNSGVAILMSTHDLTQAVDICDRLVMINRTIQAVGEPAKMLDRKLWMQTYQVQEDSALLRMLGMGVK